MSQLRSASVAVWMWRAPWTFLLGRSLWCFPIRWGGGAPRRVPPGRLLHHSPAAGILVLLHTQQRLKETNLFNFWTRFSEERGRQPGCHGVQKTHAHRPLSEFPVSSSPPCQEGSGQMFARQGQEHHQLTGQSRTGGAPHRHGLEAEQLPWCLHLFLCLATAHPGPWWPGNGIAGRWHAEPPTGDVPIWRRNQLGRQTCLQEVQPEGDLQIREIPSIVADQGQGHTSSREAIQGCVPDPLQLWKGLHWGDNQEARDKDEGAPGCLLQGNGGEVGRGGTRLGHHHPIEWESTRVIDRAGRSKELQLKEALHIQTATEALLNRDIGLEVPGCWLAILKRKRSAADAASPERATASDVWHTLIFCACL